MFKIVVFISSIERSCPLCLYLFVSFFLLEKCYATSETFLDLKKLPLTYVHLHCVADNANALELWEDRAH